MKLSALGQAFLNQFLCPTVVPTEKPKKLIRRVTYCLSDRIIALLPLVLMPG